MATQIKFLDKKEIPEPLLDEKPETSIGLGVSIAGELSFERLLRIDGTFEGKLVSQGGSVVVGKRGTLIADVTMETLVVDSGRVLGDVQVERLVLRGCAVSVLCSCPNSCLS